MMGTNERIKQLVTILGIIDRLSQVGPPNVIGAPNMSIIRSTREVEKNGPTLIPEIEPRKVRLLDALLKVRDRVETGAH